jgi:hypothetical protein
MNRRPRIKRVNRALTKNELEALRLSVHRGRPLETSCGRKKWRSHWAWAIRSALAAVPAGNRQRFDRGDLMAAFQGGGCEIGACVPAAHTSCRPPRRPPCAAQSSEGCALAVDDAGVRPVRGLRHPSFDTPESTSESRSAGRTKRNRPDSGQECVENGRYCARRSAPLDW